MKYLLPSLGALTVLSFVALARASEPAFEVEESIFESGISYNEDVSRKFTLDAAGVIESQIDIRFRPNKKDDTRSYYHVIEAGLAEHNLVSIDAVVATSQNAASVEKLATSKLPTAIKELLESRNATQDVQVYKITTKKDELINGQLTLSLKELYKRRKNPFPSKIQIRDEQQVKFVDTKYFLSVYPTKS